MKLQRTENIGWAMAKPALKHAISKSGHMQLLLINNADVTAIRSTYVNTLYLKQVGGQVFKCTGLLLIGQKLINEIGEWHSPTNYQ